MKHTNFYQLYNELDARSRAELAAAVKAHGGEYVWPEDDPVDGPFKPVVVATTPCGESPCDFIITRVELTDSDYPMVYGIEKCYGMDEVRVNVEGAHIQYIIDEIPETDEVRDVSPHPKFPLYYSVDDITVATIEGDDIEEWKQLCFDDEAYLEYAEFDSIKERNAFITGLRGPNYDERAPAGFAVLFEGESRDDKFIQIWKNL